ncbi:MAG: MBL fold metallo-hydrolase [Alphaproteobacteria bacterium]|nr:MBL fold metallo-hydrolase [Alphaproteobacteria bacterium]
MGIRFASLGSGSKGNGTLIDDGNTCLLIDLGFTIKESVRRLSRLGMSPDDVDAILVTHEHADHIHGVAGFARKFSTPVYLTPGTYQAKLMALFIQRSPLSPGTPGQPPATGAFRREPPDLRHRI